MSLFKGIKTKIALSRLQEEQLYEFISDELEVGNVRKGLMTKALAQADGDPLKTQAEYIKLRLQSLIDENTLMEAIQSIIQKNASQEKPPQRNITDDKPPPPETKKDKIDLGINMDDDNRYAMDDVKEADWLKEFKSKQSD
tara:strand:- start:190 stop:612 length:423 start_codon:yes stop_codon:yes gene_type:complete